MSRKIKKIIKRNKLGQFMPGTASWNKNVPMSRDVKEKLKKAHTGKKQSEETKRKIRLNSTRYWLNKHLSQKTKQKLRLANLGKKASLKTRKKMSLTQRKRKCGPNKGKTFNKKWRENIRKGLLGILSGDKHWNWKNGITPQSVKERTSPKTKQFTQEILRRDNYICQICSLASKDKYPDTSFFRKHKCVGKWTELEVDHIMPWSLYPKLRQNSENVRTLCKPCHGEYGANPYYKPPKYATSPIDRGSIIYHGSN